MAMLTIGIASSYNGFAEAKITFNKGDGTIIEES